MTYSISINGSGAEPEDVQEIFENLIQALRSVTEEGTSGPTGQATIDGTVTQATDVADEEDPDETDDDAVPGADPNP